MRARLVPRLASRRCQVTSAAHFRPKVHREEPGLGRARRTVVLESIQHPNAAITPMAVSAGQGNIPRLRHAVDRRWPRLSSYAAARLQRSTSNTVQMDELPSHHFCPRHRLAKGDNYVIWPRSILPRYEVDVYIPFSCFAAIVDAGIRHPCFRSVRSSPRDLN